MRYCTILSVKVELDHDGWQLYSKPGAEAAADDLNSMFESMVRQGFSREEIENNMSNLMEKYADLGACDTEPRQMLRALLDDVFPR